MPTNKKRLIIITVSVLLVIATIVITVLLIKSFNNKTKTVDESSITDIETKAAQAIKDNNVDQDIETKAAQAIKDNNVDQAKKLYEELKQKYADANNTDGVAEVDGRLYDLNHPVTLPPQTVLDSTEAPPVRKSN